MSKTYKSPFATSFKSAIKRGTPCSVAVQNIASRNKKSPQTVFESLFKAGLCHRQKFNGQWIYWPVNVTKNANATNRNECQWNMWQSFVDWFISSGFCTPEKLNNCASSQQEFMAFCRKYFNKQFATNSKPKSKKSKRTRKSNKRRSTTTKARKSSTRGRKRTTGKKRTASPKSKKRSTTTRSKKRNTTTKARKRTTGRKTSPRKNATRNYKFPTSSRSTSRKAA